MWWWEGGRGSVVGRADGETDSICCRDAIRTKTFVRFDCPRVTVVASHVRSFEAEKHTPPYPSVADVPTSDAHSLTRFGMRFVSGRARNEKIHFFF